MGTVFVDMVMSLDGFVAGPNNGDGGLHDWYFAPCGPAVGVIDELPQTIGAMIIGRRSFGDQPEGFDTPYKVPHFVLTHTPRQTVRNGDAPFIFVADGIESALAQAQAAAGEKAVCVAGGAMTVQQFLNAGLVDELQIRAFWAWRVTCSIWDSAWMRLSIVSISVAAERLFHVSARNTADAPGTMTGQPDFQPSRRNAMLATTRAIPTVKTTIWAGRIISAFAIVFLAFDSLIKVLNLAPAVDATTQLGYPASLVITLGVLELICLAIYAIPRTAVPGVILLTGYLGGAIATQVRAGSSLFSILFPLIIGALIWGGLFLRDERLRALLLQR